MRIFHLSDTHVGPSQFFNEEALYNAIDTINEGDYDLVIHTGDVTEGGQPQEYRRAKRIFDSIRAPFVVLPGNHDARSGGELLFRDTIGATDGCRVIGDALIIHVGSAIADSNAGRIGRTKYTMVRDALDRYGSKPIKILATHHHIVPVPRSGRERNVLSNGGDLIDLIVRADVDLVLAGHRHFPNVHRIENTPFVNAGTVSSRKTRYGDVNSYNVIEIDAEQKSVSTIRSNGQTDVVNYPRRQHNIVSCFGKRVVRLAHVSNTFITNGPAFLPKHFRNAVAAINDLEPDYVIHCGGIVHEGIQRDYDEAMRLLRDLEAPISYSPSGRDLNYLGYHLFGRYLGPLDQDVKSDLMRLAGVCASQYDSTHGIVGEQRRSELIDELQNDDANLRAVFMHHNVVPVPQSRNKALLEDAGDVLRELVDARIDLVLTGTSSHPHAVKVGETVVVNANSLSSVYQRSPFGNSFNIIDVYEQAIVVFEINSLWGKRRLLGLWERTRS
jgi:3',5'-cyclic AMP phosphodiesterase CpdA